MENTPFAQTIGPDRLHKAIERNRRKQELRNLRTPTSNLSSRNLSRESSMGDTIEMRSNATLGSRPWSTPGPTPSSTIRRAAPTPKTEVVAVEPMSTISSTRKTVATGDQLEFSTALRATPSRAPAKPAYTSAKRKVKTRKSNDRFSQIMLKSAWAFCGFLLLRLIFSGGGILDYNERGAMLDARLHELESIKLDNQKTLAEIELIQKDSLTQKKLVRDHLGFIANDEYLVIFPKDSSRSGEDLANLDAGLSASL